MSSKQQILEAVRAMAKRLGRPPTLFEFVSSAGVSRHSVLRFFPKWNDAVRAAKLRPGSPMIAANDPEERVTIFMVWVATWSDGTPAPMH